MTTNTDWLSAPRIGRILLLLIFLATPHLLKMPPWASAAVVLIGVWRLVIARRGLANPHTAVRLLFAAALAASVIFHYGSLNGLEAGTALLCVMTAMKLLETRTRRDCRLLIYLGYMLLLSQLLRSQDIPWVFWLMVGFVCNTAVLVDLQHPQSLLALRHNLALSGRLAVKALPIAILLFVLFPRLPGPLWGLPRDTAAGRSGLSESMEPGNISKLALSDEVAFRVRFEGAAPPNRELYWRGPVLSDWDGARWEPRPDNSSFYKPKLEFGEPTYRYEVQLEAHGRKYMLALDMPISAATGNTYLDSDYVLKTRQAIMDARLLPLSSSPNWRLDVAAPRWLLLNYLKLPSSSPNPKTQALVRGWTDEAAEAGDIVRFALQYFRTETFRYTLEPPLLRGSNRIDDFLFETRAGFCEHYAAAFVVMMRMAGLPARVVTGYQGAEANSDYYIVRQSDAHAWAEVWIPEQGWRRVDPTAAIAPDRIEFGLAAALGDSDLLPSLARGNNRGRNFWIQMELALDILDANWNRWILAFGPELQRKLLSKIGLGELRQMLFALVAVAAISGLLLAAHLAWQHRRRPPSDPLQKFRWRLLRKTGVNLPDSQLGPRQIESALRRAGRWDATMERLLGHYARLRYAQIDTATAEQVKTLERALAAWEAPRPGATESERR